jgi:hypothetical protein
MVTVRFDLRIRPGTLKKAIMKMFNFYRKKVLIESRKERYTKTEIHEVKIVLNKAMNGMEIFRKLYPQFAWFNQKRDYTTNDQRKHEHFDALAGQIRTYALINRAKGKK